MSNIKNQSFYVILLRNTLKNLNYFVGMKKEYIAIDLGATSGRVVLSCLDENKAVTMQALHRFPTPLLEQGGKYFWDIFKIRDEIIVGLSKAAGHKIESIGIDTWGVDFCKVDTKGELHLPRAYRDPYTSPALMEDFFSKMPREELYRRTGIQIMNLNSVFQLYAQYKEGGLNDAAKLLFVPDALSYMLTGKMVCEYSILSTAAIMDPRTKTLDKDILALCGLTKDVFPDMVFPGTEVGVLTDELAVTTGLGKVKVIAVAGHDTGSAVAAVPAQNSHFAYLSSGTWSLMGIETEAPVINEKMFSMNFTNEGGVRGTTRLLKNITGMWLLEQCLAQWRKDGRDYSYAQVVEMALSVPESKSLINPDDPDFAAPQNMPATIRSKVKEDLSDAAIIRLIYDSLAAKYAEVFGKLKEIAPFSIDVLHIIGGGCQNELLDQMTADACGAKVVAGPSEGTALGNVMVQAGLSRKDLLSSIETKTFLPKNK